MLPYKRSARVAKSIQRAVNDFLHKEVKVEGLGIITITDAEISDDLRHASVFYSVYGSDAEKKKTGKFMVKIASAVRSYIGKQLSLRHTPEIVFKHDGTVEYAARIDELIHSIHREDKEKNG